jgi:hypothetical protein
MKHRLYLAALATAALPLSACSPTAISSAGTVSAAADVITVDSTRGLILAELGYQTVANLALAGVQSGAIRGAAAATVVDLNKKATAALIAAHSATTDVDRAAEVAKLMDATFSLQSLKK